MSARDDYANLSRWATCDSAEAWEYETYAAGDARRALAEVDLLREVAAAARRLCDMGDYPALNATLNAWETR